MHSKKKLYKKAIKSNIYHILYYLIPVSLCEWFVIWSIYEYGFLENFSNYKLGHET